MTRVFFGIFILCFGSTLLAQTPPKLVVGIVVDQMRHDYLTRFQPKYSEGGFRKLMREGFEARNTHYNYVPTATGPGHASIYTGTTPRYHGIIGNDWYNRKLQRPYYCSYDSTARNLGGSASAGEVSPVNLLSSTVTDELRLSSNFKSKVIGVSIKDRGAVLPAGRAGNAAYWYDGKTGQFMSSTYYMEKLPAWVETFNSRNRADMYSSMTWTTLLPIEQYTESTADNTPYEKGFTGKDTPTFPYVLADLRKTDRFGLIRSTPFGNSLLLEFAKAAIEGEKMGQGPSTDFLCLSFSSPDYIGHNFGPRSIEVEDTYLRLDRDIADLLTWLDTKIGKGKYLIFLTADHAVVDNPQFLIDNKLSGGYQDVQAAAAHVMTKMKETFGPGEWIEDVSNDQVFLNRELIRQNKMDLEETQRKVADIIREIKTVEEVFTASDFNRFDYTEPRRAMLQRGFNSNLSGDLIVLEQNSFISGGYGKQGTTHGSSYTYDTHVPLLFYGSGIKKGSTTRYVTITDIAPTVSFLLDISLPGAATGQPIWEILDK